MNKNLDKICIEILRLSHRLSLGAFKTRVKEELQILATAFLPQQFTYAVVGGSNAPVASSGGDGGRAFVSSMPGPTKQSDQEPRRPFRSLGRGVAVLLLLLIIGVIICLLCVRSNHNRLNQLNNNQESQAQLASRAQSAASDRTGRLELKVKALDDKINKLKVGSGDTNIGGSGTSSNQALGSDVTLGGNVFNGPNQLVRLTAGGLLPVLNGANLTSLNATTLQGNGPSYYTNASNLNSGTLSDARLSGNVALLNAANTFSAQNTFNSTVVLNTLGAMGGSAICINGSNQLSDCGPGSTATLQQSYQASTSPQIDLMAVQGGLIIRDAALPIGGNLFAVQSNGGGSTYLGVTASGVNISGTTTLSSFGTAGVVTNTSGGVLGTVANLGVATGGTGAGSFTANGILYGNGSSAIQATTAAANAILATNGSNIPSLTQTLPSAVQANITGTGALTTGSIGGSFGSIITGNNITTSATMQGGTITATGALQGNTLSINSGAFAVNSAGAITASTGIVTSGAYTQSGAGANTFSGATSLTAAGTALSVTNNATIGGTLAVQGATALTLGTASTNTGAIVFKGSGGAGILTLQGPTTPNAGNFTLSIPAITGNANVCTDNSICAGYAATPLSGSYIQQVPTTTAANTITPATSGVVGLTVNGTNTGTAATALNILQGGAATGLVTTSSSTGDGQAINLTNTSGTQTNGLAITRNGTGGTTTNLLNLTNTLGTATNAIALSGTYTNLINAGAAFTVSNAGNITAGGTYNTNTFTSSALTFGAASTATIQPAGSQALTITGHAASTWSTDAGNLTIQAATTNTLALDTGGAGTVTVGGANATVVTIGNGTDGTAVSVLCGSGTCGFGNNAVDHSTIVGSTTGTSVLTLQAGTGGINLGNDGIANTLQIGTTTGAVTQNINIGNNATASSVTALIIGSTVGASSMQVRCGTGACAFGTSATVHATTIGSGTGGSSLALTGGSGGVNINTGAVANTLQMGTTTGAVAQIIRIGTNATASSTSTLTLGSLIGTSAVTIQAGTSGVTFAPVGGSANVGVLIKPGSDTSAAFQIQNAGATATLLSADTTSLIVTVAGTTSTFGNLTLTNTHFKSTQTTAPTIGTPTSCGTSPSASVTSGSTDAAGSFTITSGSGSATATCQVVITFNKAYGAAPKSVQLTGASTAAALETPAVTATGTTTFTVVMPVNDAISTAYQFYYWVVE